MNGHTHAPRETAKRQLLAHRARKEEEGWDWFWDGRASLELGVGGAGWDGGVGGVVADPAAAIQRDAGNVSPQMVPGCDCILHSLWGLNRNMEFWGIPLLSRPASERSVCLAHPDKPKQVKPESTMRCQPEGRFRMRKAVAGGRKGGKPVNTVKKSQNSEL